MELNKVNLDLGGGSVLQVANRGKFQMMFYLIETASKKVIVIDGGGYNRRDAEHLYELLCERDKKVDLWLITHAHSDHLGALTWLLENEKPFDVDIGKVCFHLPPFEWLKHFNTADNVPVPGGKLYVETLLENLLYQGIKVEEVRAGDVLCLDEIQLEILHDASNYEQYERINDTSLVIRVSFKNCDFLFLGDLGELAGSYVLQNCDHDKLRCKVVQMAHHGQDGVGRDFYEVVRPEICLYTAPAWLWENDNGGGRNSGPWKTLETRSCMEGLGRVLDCPMAYGDYLFY